MGDHGPELRIGTSGYQYRHWRGLLYPPKLPARRWFECYARHFDTVEMNTTFYHLPSPETFDNWRERAPVGFTHALKYSRYGSHIMHLKSPELHLGPYLQNARRLGETLGPILVQLPPRWSVDVDRLNSFLAAAPRDIRWAVEFRHDSWLCSATYRVLRDHEAALCIHDRIRDHPREMTAPWTYLRYHGGGSDGSYPEEHLRSEASRIRGYLERGLHVFAYFNNDLHGHALLNASDLKHLVTGDSNDMRDQHWFC